MSKYVTVPARRLLKFPKGFKNVKGDLSLDIRLFPPDATPGDVSFDIELADDATRILRWTMPIDRYERLREVLATSSEGMDARAQSQYRVSMLDLAGCAQPWGLTDQFRIITPRGPFFFGVGVADIVIEAMVELFNELDLS